MSLLVKSAGTAESLRAARPEYGCVTPLLWFSLLQKYAFAFYGRTDLVCKKEKYTNHPALLLQVTQRFVRVQHGAGAEILTNAM